MGGCQVRVQRQSPLNFFTRMPVTLLSRNTTCHGLPLAYPRQSDPRQRIGGIKLRRPFVVLRRQVRIFVAVPLKEVVPLQVSIEGFRIDWLRPSQLRLLSRGQAHFDFPRTELATFSSTVRTSCAR